MDELRHLADSRSTPQTTDGLPIEGLPVIVYDVVRYRGSWRVLHVGKHSSPHPSQAAAIESALKAAAQDMANGRIVTVRLNRTDGRIFDLARASTRAG